MTHSLSDEETVEDESSRNLSTTSPEAPAEARTQASEYESLFGYRELPLDGGCGVIKVPPHPDYGMLDDEAMEAYDELMFKMDTEYDREDDIYIPEQRLKDPKTGKETGVVLPPTTDRGRLKHPFRIKNELVKPPHSVKIVQIALGETEYKRLREGGRNASDVWKIWGEQSLKIQERQKRDKFPTGRPVDMASVPPADS